MDKIKNMVERLIISNYFDRDTITADELKIKIKILKKMNKKYNLIEFHNRPDAVPSIITYYFQIKVNELFIKYFEFKINYNALKENIDYLNDCYNEIEKGLQK